LKICIWTHAKKITDSKNAILFDLRWKIMKLSRKNRFWTVASPGAWGRLAVLNWRLSSIRPSSLFICLFYLFIYLYFPGVCGLVFDRAGCVLRWQSSLPGVRPRWPMYKQCLVSIRQLLQALMRTLQWDTIYSLAAVPALAIAKPSAFYRCFLFHFCHSTLSRKSGLMKRWWNTAVIASAELCPWIPIGPQRFQNLGQELL